MSKSQKRYTLEQLGRLQELTSSIDCECPNHLAAIVSSLGAFEDYSARCQNKNADDAAIHRLLYEASQQARILMEEALVKLCAHEKISL